MAAREALKRKVLEGLEFANRQAKAAIQLSQTTNTTKIKQSTLNGVTDERAAINTNSVEQTATTQRIELIKKQIAQTKKLRADGTYTAKEATDKEIQLNQQLADANGRLVDLQIDKQKQLQAEIQKTFERKKAEVELTRDRRENEIQRNALNQRLTGPVDVQALDLTSKGQSLQVQQKALEDTRKLLQQQQKELESIQMTESDRLTKRQEMQKEFVQLDRDEISIREQLRENDIAQFNTSIDRKISSQRRASDLAVAAIDREKQASDLLTKSLDIQSKLIESRGALQKAKSDAATSRTQSQIDATSQGLELRKRVDSEQDPAKRAKLQGILGQMGYGGASELDILKKKQALENQLADQQAAARQADLAIQQQQLEIELQRNQIAAQQVLMESKIADLKQRQLISEKQGELQKAVKEGDTEKIAQAQSELKIAQDGMSLIQQQTQMAQQQLSANQELAANARERLATEQANAAAIAQSTDEARRFAQMIEQVDANPSIGINKPPGRAKGGPVTANQLYMVGERGPELFVPGASGSIIPNHALPNVAAASPVAAGGANQMQAVMTSMATLFTGLMPAIMQAMSAVKPSQPQKPVFGVQTNAGVQTNQGLGYDAINKSMAIASQPTPQFNQVATSNNGVSASGNNPGDLIKEFRELKAAIVANSGQPRSLTVQSSQPVQDAAKIWSDTRKAQTQSLGI